MLKLKLQYFGHLMQRVGSLEKTLMLGGIGGRRRRGRQRMRWLDVITDLMDIVWVNSGIWWWTGRPGVLRFMGCKELNTTEWLNWWYYQLLCTNTILYVNYTHWKRNTWTTWDKCYTFSKSHFIYKTGIVFLFQNYLKKLICKGKEFGVKHRKWDN